MTAPGKVVRLPARPGCVPALGLPFLLAAPIVLAVAVRDLLAHTALWHVELLGVVALLVVGGWGVFARHGWEIDVGQGAVRSGTGLFRPRLRNRRVLGLPLQLEVTPFKLVVRGAVQTAYTVMLVGPAGRVKLDDFPEKRDAEARKVELAELLGLSPPPATP